MKKTTILFVLLCFSTCWGQRKVVLDDIQRIINQRIDDAKLKATTNLFFSNYTTAKPISRAELMEGQRSPKEVYSVVPKRRKKQNTKVYLL